MASTSVRVVKADPIILLLDELRVNPTQLVIQKIVALVEEERGDYFHLRLAVERALARPLTEVEQHWANRLQ